MSMFSVRIILFCLVLLYSLTWAGPSSASDPGYVISLQFENDFFGGGTDRHFTHGTRIECLTRPIKWITDGANKLPWFNSQSASANDSRDALKGRASFTIGQNMYTPKDTFATGIVPDDRPYGGWLYLGFGLVANQGSERYDKVQLEIGMVGPASLAEDVQTFWHSSLGIHVPEGWDNQLDNEPGVVLLYEQARRFDRRDTVFDLEMDLVPHFGGSLGNVFTYAATGVTGRLGPDLKDDFGPPRIRPSLPGGGYFRPEKGLNWYLFAGLEGRAVLRNIFLDGNTFSDSHSVEKRILVGDLQAGITFQWSSFRISYTQIFRTKEFESQDEADIFGSLSVSYQF
ncbi:lipid A deacylase LpxR family protein [Thermodesulfobacteriota bacterium]